MRHWINQAGYSPAWFTTPLALTPEVWCLVPLLHAPGSIQYPWRVSSKFAFALAGIIWNILGYIGFMLWAGSLRPSVKSAV